MNAIAPVEDSLVKLIRLWRDDPVLFGRSVYGFDPDPWQEDLMRRVASGEKRVIVRSGVGVGKSAALVIIMMWWLVTRSPCKVLLTSSKREQVMDVFWPEIELWERKKRPEFNFLKVRKTEDMIVLVGFERTNMILPRTASSARPDTIQGQHSPNMLVVADEVFGIPLNVMYALEGAMSTPGSVFLAAGNPTTTEGFAFDCFNLNSGWSTMTVSAWDSKLVDNSHCEYLRDRYGEDSFQYRTRVLGLPPFEDAMQVISRKFVEQCLGNDAEPFLNYREHWGLDVAGAGIQGDRTALAFRRANVQPRKALAWKGLEAPQIVDKVMATWNAAEEKPAIIGVDANGLGWGVYGFLHQELRSTRTRVIPIKDHMTANDKDNYANLGSELLWRMAEWVKDPASVLVDREMADEMTWYRADETAKWKQITKKPSRDFDLNFFDSAPRSPDKADAFKYTFARRDIPEAPRRRAQMEEHGSWLAI